MLRTIRVLVAVQEPVERIGIQSMLSDDTDLTVVAETDDSIEAIRLCRELQPDIVLSTLHVAGSKPVDFVIHLRQDCPQTKILLWSTRCETTYLHELVKAGIAGYLLKDVTPDGVVKAIGAVIEGINCFSPSVIGELIREEENEPDLVEVFDLTWRERQILGLMGEGKGNNYIAEKLDLSPQTIRNYSSSLYSKLGVGSRNEAILWFRKHSLNEE